MEKTIAQIATEIGVSRQAIHKKIKKEPLSTSLQQFTLTKGNTNYITVDGQNLIKSAFDKDKSSTSSTNFVDDITTKFISSLQLQIDNLNIQNEDLRKQLNTEREHSREQTDRITDLARELAQLTGNAQKLHAGDMVPRLIGSELRNPEDESQEVPEKKKGFLYRIFGKNE